MGISGISSTSSESAETSRIDLNSAAARDATFMCPVCAFVSDRRRAIQRHCIDVHHADWQGDGLPLRDIPLENSAAVTQTFAALGCSSSPLSWWTSAFGFADMANQTQINYQLSSFAVGHVQNSGQVQFGLTTDSTLTHAPLPCQLPVVQPEQYAMMAPDTELLSRQPEMITPFTQLFGLPPKQIPFRLPPPGKFSLRLPPPAKFLFQGLPPSSNPATGEVYGPRAETSLPPGEITLRGPPPEDAYVQLL